MAGDGARRLLELSVPYPRDNPLIMGDSKHAQTRELVTSARASKSTFGSAAGGGA